MIEASFDLPWRQLAFWISLVLVSVVSLFGLALLLVRHGKSRPAPFHSFWAELGWGLVPVILLWLLLAPAAFIMAERLGELPAEVSAYQERGSD